MASRRDQLHSYQFVVQRVISALVTREADTGASPFSRLAGSTFAGFMVTMLVVAGFGLYGLLTQGGNTSWQKQNTIVVEKGSSQVYVYRDNVLNPVINYASALLIAGTAKAEPEIVSAASLVGVPRGVPLGIAGAPGSLPTTDQLVDAPWTLCSHPDRNEANNPITTTVLVVGSAPAGGQNLGDRGLLVADASRGGEATLVWRKRRYPVRGGNAVLGALNWTSKQRVPVGTAWLNALPAGRDITAVPVPQRGQRSVFPNAVAGQVGYVEGGGSKQYYTVLTGGLAPITPLQAQIMLGDPATADLYPGRNPRFLVFAAADANRATRIDALQWKSDEAGQPQAPPAIAEPATQGGGTVCATYGGAGAPSEILVDAALPRGSKGTKTQRRTTDGVALADRVIVPAGQAAVVEAVASEQAPSGGLNLITDQGVRYPVPSREVLGYLGYGDVKPRRVLASLVARIPEGPALDPARAKEAVQPTGP